MEDAKIIALYFARNEQAISQTDAKYGRYCYSIAQNILRSHPDSEECVSHRGDPASETELQELQAAIGQFLETLSRREQGIFLRRYFYAESTDQIAKRYEVKDAHVRLILSRTREKLRNHLKKEGFLE